MSWNGNQACWHPPSTKARYSESPGSPRNRRLPSMFGKMSRPTRPRRTAQTVQHVSGGRQDDARIRRTCKLTVRSTAATINIHASKRHLVLVLLGRRNRHPQNKYTTARSTDTYHITGPGDQPTGVVDTRCRGSQPRLLCGGIWRPSLLSSPGAGAVL